MKEEDDILTRFVSGECAGEEQEFVLRRLATDEAYRKEYAALRDVLFSVSVKQDTGDYRKEIEDILHKVKPVRSFHFHKTWWCAAAVVAVLITTVIGFMWFRPVEHSVEYVFHEVPAGKRMELDLPDGSHVWLNGGSVIRYASTFGKTERSLELDGEAYFDVVKNPDMAFVVNSKVLQVEVFGTRFNMNCYDGDEKMIASLDEGSIAVRIKKEKGVEKFIRLNPHEQVIFNCTDQNLTKEVFSEAHTWKDGFLVLKQDSPSSMLKKIERRFGVRIHVRNIENNHYLYTGTFSGESLGDMLDAINFLTPIEYTVNNEDVNLAFKEAVTPE